MTRFKLASALLLSGAALLSAGCGNAERAGYAAWGKNHKVTFYPPTGPVEIFHAEGTVDNEANSDGCRFKDAKTQQLVRIQGVVKIEIEE